MKWTFGDHMYGSENKSLSFSPRSAQIRNKSHLLPSVNKYRLTAQKRSPCILSKKARKINQNTNQMVIFVSQSLDIDIVGWTFWVTCTDKNHEKFLRKRQKNFPNFLNMRIFLSKLANIGENCLSLS